jgi:hypothetical protein
LTFEERAKTPQRVKRRNISHDIICAKRRLVASQRALVHLLGQRELALVGVEDLLAGLHLEGSKLGIEKDLALEHLQRKTDWLFCAAYSRQKLQNFDLAFISTFLHDIY